MTTAPVMISLKLPLFWPKDLQVWFAQVEAQSSTCGISAQQTMFNYVVALLSRDCPQSSERERERDEEGERERLCISTLCRTPTRADRNNCQDGLTLQAVNNTSIPTYGKRSLLLDLRLHRTFHWVFIIAEVKTPILGYDFLRPYGLNCRCGE